MNSSTLTVKEVLEQLAMYPPDMKVAVSSRSDPCHMWFANMVAPDYDFCERKIVVIGGNGIITQHGGWYYDNAPLRQVR